MNGHATANDMKLVREYEARVRCGGAASRDQITLALLYWEPCHREEEAISVLENLIQSETQNNLAKLWLAYLEIFYRSVYDPSGTPLNRAIELLGDIVRSDPDYAAAAQIVLEGAFSHLDPKTEMHSRRIQALEDAVRLRPDWVHNHYYLAALYAKMGRYDEALVHLERARENVLPAATEMDYPDRQFEIFITGRLGHRIVERALDPLAEGIRRAAARGLKGLPPRW
jgi:tetratricopeptide (TPR) repeat protein